MNKKHLKNNNRLEDEGINQRNLENIDKILRNISYIPSLKKKI